MLRKRSYSGTRNEPAGDGAAAPPDPPDGERWQPMTFMEYVEKAHPDLRESGFTREELPSSRATTQGQKIRASATLGYREKKNAPGKVMKSYVYVLQAGLAKKSFFFGHLFFNITNVFCAKTRVGHACICPRMVTS